MPRCPSPSPLVVPISFSHCLCPFRLVFLVVCQLVSHTLLHLHADKPPSLHEGTFVFIVTLLTTTYAHSCTHTYFSLLPLFPCLITITGLWVMRLIAVRAACRVCVLSYVSKSKSSSQQKTGTLVTLKVFVKQELLNFNDFLRLFRSGGIFYSL